VHCRPFTVASELLPNLAALDHQALISLSAASFRTADGGAKLNLTTLCVVMPLARINSGNQDRGFTGCLTVKKMSLTHEQKELLKAVARVYASGDHGSFIFCRSIDEVDTGRLLYSRHPNVVVHNVDESDLMYLEREGLLTLQQSSSDLSGKPTMKGIGLAMRSIPSDQRTQPPPGSVSPPPRTAPPPSGTLPSPVPVEFSSGINKPNRPDSIFIGHGGSSVWLVLEKHLTKTLGLNCTEFNAKPAAGYTTQHHLEKLLASATFAFLVMTAEDRHEDGTLHARENVVHEAGLFQGKLGFPNAVLLVEDDCALPSNLLGLTYIRFVKGRIETAFHEIGEVLKDRNIVR
jgi:hypothetical protein